MTRPEPVQGSFRDPAGHIYRIEDRIFRTISDVAAGDYEFVRDSGFLSSMADSGAVIATREVGREVLGDVAANARHVVEHPKIEFVSWPYEWSFPMLRAAALHHLDVHLAALEADITLSDASAYNIQFEGTRPLFMDILSFRPYREGELWIGHRQFCEQFLNPLLMRAKLGIVHNYWYRGSQEGIPAADLRRMLPLSKKLSWNVMVHVVAQAALQASGTGKSDDAASAIKAGKLPKAAFVRMLNGLKSWIAKLEPAGGSKTVWRDYATDHSYSDQEALAKTRFVASYAGDVMPGMLWDLGCNTGDYSESALRAGAKKVIGFDFDQGALEVAFARAETQSLDFLPLFFDGANPSPDQGWNQAERQGMKARADADGILALAFVHHLAIAKNIPLDELVAWLISLAPTGVLEFVPKSDPMVGQLLRLREDIFADYTEETFRALISERASIVREEKVSATGRRLIQFAKRP